MPSYVNGFDKEKLIYRICDVSTPYKTLGNRIEDELSPLEIKTDLCDIYNLLSVVSYDDWQIYRDRTTNKLYVVTPDDDENIIREVICVGYLDYDKNYNPRLHGRRVKNSELDNQFPNDYCGEFDDMTGYGYFVKVEQMVDIKYIFALKMRKCGLCLSLLLGGRECV